MMFVIKGVNSLASKREGELAIVSYQDSTGSHNMSFYFDREEIYTDFNIKYNEVIAKLDKRPDNVVLHSGNVYISATNSIFELIDMNLYTTEDRDLQEYVKEEVTSADVILQRVRANKFIIFDIDSAVRTKSHMKQYGMNGITLAMKLAWENPVKFEDIDSYPIPPYYADFEALTDIVYLDYAIKDFTTKSVQELTQEVDYLEDEELEEIVEQYEESEEYVEEPIDDDQEEEEIEIDLGTLQRRTRPQKVMDDIKEEQEEEPQEETKEEVKEEPKKLPKVEEKPKANTKKKNTQPRTRDGKFAPKKKK